MNDQLHPQTLGEILDRTAQMYRSRFLVYFGIAVIPAGILVVFAAACFFYLAWAGSGAADDATQTMRIVVGVLVFGVLGLIALPAYLGSTALGWAALTHAAADTFLGSPISIRGAYKSAWTKGWRYLGLCLVIGAFVGLVPFGVFIVLTMGGGVLTALATRSGLGDLSAVLGGFMVLLMLALGVYVVLALLRLCLAFPACVVEQIGAWGAVKRAYALSKGTQGRIFLLLLLGLALGWLLVIGMSIPLFIVLALIPGMNNPQHAERMGQMFMFIWYGLSFAVQAFTRPVYGIAFTLFYLDQRIRTEGFDIELKMRDAGMLMAPEPQPEATPWLPPIEAMPVVANEVTASARETADTSATTITTPPTGDPA